MYPPLHLIPLDEYKGKFTLYSFHQWKHERPITIKGEGYLADTTHFSNINVNRCFDFYAAQKNDGWTQIAFFPFNNL